MIIEYRVGKRAGFILSGSVRTAFLSSLLSHILRYCTLVLGTVLVELLFFLMLVIFSYQLLNYKINIQGIDNVFTSLH